MEAVLVAIESLSLAHTASRGVVVFALGCDLGSGGLRRFGGLLSCPWSSAWLHDIWTTATSGVQMGHRDHAGGLAMAALRGFKVERQRLGLGLIQWDRVVTY